MNEWIGAGLTVLLEAIKPAARWFSEMLGYPMRWANIVLAGTPWPMVIGVATALGWFLGGTRMAALGLAGLGFVLASGYWVQSMNTLALAAVSVPLALLLGGAIGALANEVPRVKRAVQTLLDVMQTVPTFAYLTPLLLFGFGPVVGLIASAIYAAPPMARNVILGLERVEPEIKEAAVMSGGNRWQQLFLVEIPSASMRITVGVNQCLMAALSMEIIAAVIGGSNDIGWEVLLTMRKAQFGQSFLAGLVIVVFAVGMLAAILLAGLFERALLSLYLSGASALACAVVGCAIGRLCAMVPMAWRIVQPVCDMLRTIPLFVFLIPVRMFFQIGEFSAFLAICAYAIVPMIRYTRHGLVTTPDDMLEAAVASGATEWQILREVRATYAAPTILLGLNQTINYAFSMLVIAALIGTTDLGPSIYIALGRADVGLGVAAGAAMAIPALVADRLVQGFAESRRKALGL